MPDLGSDSDEGDEPGEEVGEKPVQRVVEEHSSAWTLGDNGEPVACKPLAEMTYEEQQAYNKQWGRWLGNALGVTEAARGLQREMANARKKSGQPKGIGEKGKGKDVGVSAKAIEPGRRSSRLKDKG
ncbi:hypothetical protein MPER_14752, partial [Moniliophthora perniciosa FA553]